MKVLVVKRAIVNMLVVVVWCVGSSGCVAEDKNIDCCKNHTEETYKKMNDKIKEITDIKLVVNNIDINRKSGIDSCTSFLSDFIYNKNISLILPVIETNNFDDENQYFYKIRQCSSSDKIKKIRAEDIVDINSLGQNNFRIYDIQVDSNEYPGKSFIVYGEYDPSYPGYMAGPYGVLTGYKLIYPESCAKGSVISSSQSIRKSFSKNIEKFSENILLKYKESLYVFDVYDMSPIQEFFKYKYQLKKLSSEDEEKTSCVWSN